MLLLGNLIEACVWPFFASLLGDNGRWQTSRSSPLPLHCALGGARLALCLARLFGLHSSQSERVSLSPSLSLFVWLPADRCGRHLATNGGGVAPRARPSSCRDSLHHWGGFLGFLGFLSLLAPFASHWHTGGLGSCWQDSPNVIGEEPRLRPAAAPVELAVLH